jgi:hypothetical protein
MSKLYHIGLYLTNRKLSLYYKKEPRLSTFICKREQDIPETALFVSRITTDKPKQVADEIRQYYIAQHKRNYYIGLYITKPMFDHQNKVASFAAKDENNFPKSAFYSKLITTDTPGQETIKLLEEYLKHNKVQFRIGCVGQYSDGGKVHTAICLGQYKEEIQLLFLTSNEKWNKFARLATKEELGLVGLKNTKLTYLAPVCRPVQHIFWTNQRLPNHRVENLIKEFFKPELMDQILKF